MKIKYNILWFDDEPSWQQINEKEIKEFLDEKEFELNSHRLKGDEDLGVIKLEEFDLILMDLKLSGGDIGGQIIQKIRDMDHLTEVVFYSQSGENAVRKIVSEMSLEGVYCSGRGGDFLEKVTKVIDTTIKKVQDLNNLRGLVIAEVSNCDKRLFEIIEKHHDNLSEPEITELINKMKEKINGSLNTRMQKVSKFNNLPDVKKDIHCFETYSKWMIVKGILLKRAESGENVSEISSIFDQFHEEVTKMRNKLAHVEEHIENGVTVLKSLNDDEDFIFNHDKCDQIRGKLIKHKRNLEKIFLSL